MAKTSLNFGLKHFLARADAFLLNYFLPISSFLVSMNFFACIFVIYFVPYTEIDWIAYMQEVAGVIKSSQFDYKQLRGATGPLVYPAGFVYVYSLLYFLTREGSNIFAAQIVFAILHSLTLGLTLAIYYKCRIDQPDRNQSRFPLYIIAFLLLSRRVMSLFVLRLFNDCIQTLLIYVAVLLFIQNRWSLGCFVYSLSVSVKMNALLYAPGLAVLLCQARGFAGFLRRVIGICLVSQIVLGLPFLLHAPKSYISCAFELSREFMHKWSVNGAFLSETTFVDKNLAISLLASHLCLLLLFGHSRWTSKADGGLFGLIHLRVFGTRSWLRHLLSEKKKDLRPSHIVQVLFSSNFIGIGFARTLHYQFFVWYAHTIPLLVWGGPHPTALKVGIIAAIEIAFNIYPPSPLAALGLFCSHFLIIVSLWWEKQADDHSIYMKQKVTKVE